MTTHPILEQILAQTTKDLRVWHKEHGERKGGQKREMELTFSIISLLFLGIMLRVFTILSPLVSQMFSKGGYYSSFILEENKNLGEKRSKITHSSLLPGPGFKSRSVIIWFPCFLHYSRPQWEWVRASLHTFPMLCS